jgi:glutamate mutase epsilon subunit
LTQILGKSKIFMVIHMTLPKAKIRKINKEKFIEIAKKVHKSFEEEAKYLLEKKLKYGDTLSSHSYSLS